MKKSPEFIDHRVYSDDFDLNQFFVQINLAIH